MINRAKAVMPHFDERNRIIGVVPSNIKNAEAFPIPAKNTCNWIINAAPFCRHFNISVDRTELFDAPGLNNEDILCLDLTYMHTVSLKKGRTQRANEARNTS